MTDVVIENMIVSTNLDSTLDLEEVASRNPEATPLQENDMPGVVFHFHKPRIDVIILQDKIISIGAKSFEKAEEKIMEVIDKLREQGFKIENRDLEVENIVASCDFETTLPLDRIREEWSEEDVTFKPEEFPGLVYRYNDHVLFMLFERGKIICLGTRNLEELLSVMKDFKEKLTSVEGVAI